MNILKEGVKQGKVVMTPLAKKLTIDGTTKPYSVYKIDLDLLYYNDQNDRIATWLSQYKDTYGNDYLKTQTREDYNEVIQQFIKESNPDALRRTKNNIQLVGQREAGVVLSDGRIIDGNRRFTCLRMLEKETGKKQYFEAIVLPFGVDTDAKRIKMLELTLQQGEDVKVDYNPIDKLVGIYNDLVATKLLTIEEYAKSVNKTERMIQTDIDNAVLMVDFLKYINAENKFYICRNLDLAGPLLELESMVHRISDEDLKEKVKKAVFANFLMKPESDMTRYIRKLKKLLNTPYLEEYVNNQESINKHVENLIPQDSKLVTDDYINEKIRTEITVSDKLRSNLDEHVAKANRDETKNRPAKLVNDSYMKLLEVDDKIFVKLDEEQKEEIRNNIKKVLEKLNELSSKL